MPSVLKAIAARLKHRKRLLSRPRRPQSQTPEAADSDAGPIEHMAGLTLDSSDMKSQEGTPSPHVFGDKDYEFEFAIQSPNTQWPGPAYDKDCRFAPGVLDKPRLPKRRVRVVSPKRRLSHDERSASQKRDKHLHPGAVKPTARGKMSRAIQYYGPPPSRDPPVHLLNLPGEIRNHIYRLLCLKHDPIYATFRCLLKPKCGGTKRFSSATVVRRFPREPVLALVCHQLANEILSLFYGENKFIFERTEMWDRFKKHDVFPMTDPASLRSWIPKSGYAGSLKHVEVHFKARDTYKPFAINYTFHKDLDGNVVVSNDAEENPYCTCVEERILHEFDERRKNRSQGHVLLEAESFLTIRKEMMTSDADRLVDKPNGSAKCSVCGLDRSREILKMV